MRPTIQTLAIAASLLIQLVLFVRWIYRRIRNDELLRVFVADMATHHLPHIYHVLRDLSEQRGVARKDDPPIRWLDLNGKRH